jgi:excisionase family DNA binding protein
MSNKLSDGLLNLTEAAAQLNLSVNTVRSLIAKKDIQAIRLGRKKLRIEQAELVRYLERQKTS